LQCEHLFTPSNFTLAARLFATSEGMFCSLYGGFFRTDVPSSQYSVAPVCEIHAVPGFWLFQMHPSCFFFLYSRADTTQKKHDATCQYLTGCIIL